MYIENSTSSLTPNAFPSCSKVNRFGVRVQCLVCCRKVREMLAVPSYLVSVICTAVLYLDCVSRCSLYQALVVRDKHVRVGHNLPVDAIQELELEKLELGKPHAADARVRRVVPERVRQALGGDGGGRDEEAMHRQRVDCELGVHGAEAVDVVDHDEQQRRRQRSVLGQAVQVVADRDSGGGSV